MQIPCTGARHPLSLHPLLHVRKSMACSMQSVKAMTTTKAFAILPPQKPGPQRGCSKRPSILSKPNGFLSQGGIKKTQAAVQCIVSETRQLCNRSLKGASKGKHNQSLKCEISFFFGGKDILSHPGLKLTHPQLWECCK
ncbi:hypothetical protein O6H91_07G042700 [Diphasiastrum complanatum]|uniref:Uncharacterized protein n=1 Tax=Diphasiastrum complanatum TaxID=34168 RepID=A0ACC2D4I9_DIPCM|nr:hypothetical protein O6H91_07G042700 [Diphasiastrum complanatum]